jgi:PEP-CTERM motif
MISRRLRSFITASITLIATLSQAAPIIADGNFSDWGILANGTAAGLTPTANAGIFYEIEDQSNINNGFLSPGWGGQAYDAEAMYLTWNKKADGKTYLYVGLLTGHNPDTPTAGGSFGRGDFAIDFGRDGSFEFGVLTKNRSASLQQGAVVSTTNADWAKGLWSSPGVLATASNPSPYITHVNSGTQVGNATVTWSKLTGAFGALGGEHWFYEAEIEVTNFGANWLSDSPSKAFDVQWTMDCANDIITLDPPGAVPEPGSAALVLLGAGLLAGQRRRNSKRAAS